MIKLLTGELVPDKGSGDVWKHPNCRVAYVAQHAFHHIEHHVRRERFEPPSPPPASKPGARPGRS